MLHFLVGTIVFYVNASDPDGPASDLRLKLESNSFHLLSNGSVQLVQRLNYEVSPCSARLSRVIVIAISLFSVLLFAVTYDVQCLCT